jgi:integrase
MIYQRILCSEGGGCNRRGPNRVCSKCGQRPSGGIWSYRFRFAGRMIHESARTTSKKIAREAERNRRRELEERINGIRKRALPPTFGRAADDWLAAAKPHLAERTKDIYGVALRCHLKPALGASLLCDIDANRIASYQARRKAEAASARTLNKELQVLRQIFKRHKAWAYLQGDVKFERESDQIGRALTEEHEKGLLAACESNLLLRTVVALALNTALRKSEICTLRWHQIDLLERTLTVGRTKTAGGSGRIIPLNIVAYAVLVRWAGRFPEVKPDYYVFPACEDARLDCPKPDAAKINPARPIKSWRTAWRRATHLIECPACRRLQNPGTTCQNEKCQADIREIKSPTAGLRFHDLRHACITKLAEGQASEQTLMSIAGHLSRKMLEHYSHIRLAAKRAALDAITLQPSQAVLGVGVHQNVHQLQNRDSTIPAN